MLKTLKIVIQVIWSVLMIGSCTAIGAIVGWNRNGWGGAIVLGIVGMGVGVALAASPMIILQLTH